MISTLLALALVAAPPPPRDPYLFDSLVETARKAHEAEIDPKRGMANAMEILKAERAKRSIKAEQDALELRSAATVLRGKFISTEKTPEPLRYLQALTTYTRMDLHDPGLKYWLDKTIAHHPHAKEKFAKKASWKMKVAFLIRGSGIDREQAAKVFSAALSKVGVGVEVVPVKGAPLVISLAAEDAPREKEGDVAAQVVFGAERIQDGKVIWRTSLYRIEAAKDAKTAVAGALTWISRIGGRDIFFNWLADTFPILADPRASGGISPMGDHQHDHAPVRVKIPQQGDAKTP